jgi:hypothetical protein
LVAKGVIARVIEHLQDAVERIDIVYVCSNADIARQNVARLNVTGRGDIALPLRITLLPARLRELNKPDPDGRVKVNLVSFTPGTSFDLGNRAVFAGRRFATGCHWLQPLGSINAPSSCAV